MRGDADRRHDGHAELRRERVRVDFEATTRRDVGHVQGDDARKAQALHRQHEPEAPPQIRGVHHAHDEVGALLAGRAAIQHIGCDALVGRARIQAVGAGQVEHAQQLACGRGEPPFLALDGDTRVVRDLLAAPGEKIEERGLAAVRIADERRERAAAIHMDDCLAHRCTTAGGAT